MTDADKLFVLCSLPRCEAVPLLRLEPRRIHQHWWLLDGSLQLILVILDDLRTTRIAALDVA